MFDRGGCLIGGGVFDRGGGGGVFDTAPIAVYLVSRNIFCDYRSF